MADANSFDSALFEMIARILPHPASRPAAPEVRVAGNRIIGPSVERALTRQIRKGPPRAIGIEDMRRRDAVTVFDAHCSFFAVPDRFYERLFGGYLDQAIADRHADRFNDWLSIDAEF